nr:reverse transcriptase domain-containing protein [Tanacetum cinerariifolium]
KSLSFFKTLKKCTNKSDFQWTAEVEVAFKEMKQLIAELPMLTAPKEKEELIMYLAAAKEAISEVLMTERDRKQVPIYFVSRALQGPEINYTPMEKLILALVSVGKRLKRYFQAHTLIVITDQLIKQLLSNPKIKGRLLKWRFELGEHDIQYRPRTSVKGQILADFIVERSKDDTPDTSVEDMEELSDPWILFTDGSSCIDALIVGLWIAGQMGVQNLQANMDSKLVANHVNEIYISKESSMIKYLEKVRNMASTFKGFSIKQIPRGENKKADALSKITSTSFAHLSKQVLVKQLKEKVIDEKEILAVVEEEGHTWMTPVYEYLMEGILLEEKKKARAVRRKAGRHAVINEVLYKKSFMGPWLQREKLTPITSPWPFYKWEIDTVRPFPEGPDKKPRRRNQSTVEEISHVLWAHRTMIKSSNKETPFSLTYGAEAVIPAEIGMPTLRTAEVDIVKNNEASGISLDLLEEKIKQAAVQEARSKAKM